MFERILVPLDGSARAESVLAELKPLLAGRESEVGILQAAPPPGLAVGTEFVPLQVDAVREAQRYLAGVEERLAADGLQVRSRVFEGPPAETILRAARKLRSTLIVMATHGRSGLARLLFGSVTESVARASEVPVLAFRTLAPTAPSFDRILVPVSRVQLRILPYLKRFAARFGSTSLLLHVAGPRESVDERRESRSRLERVAQELRDSGVPSELRDREGDAARGILAAAREERAGLIAMTTRGGGRRRLARVTGKVLRASPAPLLLVRAS